jgi:hypothetical protein
MNDSFEIGEGQDEPSYFRYKAALRIFGVISDPEGLTQSLGLCPTYSHRRGDRRNLLQLKRELTVDVFLGYRSNSDTAGIEIPYHMRVWRYL